MHRRPSLHRRSLVAARARRRRDRSLERLVPPRRPHRLSVSTVLSGLHRPWDLAFTPGRRDALHRARRRRSASGSPPAGAVRTLAVPADVVAQGEGGMLGVAVDPAFATNRRIYTCFMSNRSGSLDVRLVRWRINAAVTALTDRADIVTGHAR